MGVAEIKETIKSKLDSMNEIELKEVEVFIDRLNEAHLKEWDLTGLAEKVINERRLLLNELAK
jgi:uncharacterized alkaline shock family protein YloU